MSDRYAKSFLAGWGTMDFNSHMANTAYLDMAADVRMAFFEEHGFPVAEFQTRGFGPVIRKDELEYFREVRLHQTITVTLALAAMRADGTRFVFESELFLPGGERAATVRSTGGWLDLQTRKLIAPPDDLLDVLNRIPRAAHFEALPGRASRQPSGSRPSQ